MLTNDQICHTWAELARCSLLSEKLVIFINCGNGLIVSGVLSRPETSSDVFSQ